MKKIILPIVLVLLLASCVTPVYAIPTLPHAFYGDVEINDSPAPDGTQVSAVVDVGDIVSVQNPVSTVGGKYGVNSPYLLVQGNIQSGAIVTFYVNGIVAEGVTATFEAGGGPTECFLSVAIVEPEPEPSPTPSGNGGEPTYSGEANFFGTDKTFYTDHKGEVQKTIEATSEDSNLTVIIPKGTIALGKDGKRLKTLETAIDKDPPSPPRDASIIGLTYDFGPSGATFEPPITFTWSYDPDTLPDGVAEEDLVLAFYDGYKWVELECAIDTKTNIISALVDHFTTFAIIGFAIPVPAPIPTPEIPTVAPEPEIKPTPIPPIVIVPKPEPVPEPKEPPTLLLPPEPEPQPFNWLAIILPAIAIVVVVVLVSLWVRKRRMVG